MFYITFMHFIGYDCKPLKSIFKISVSRPHCTTMSSIVLLPAAETREGATSIEPGFEFDWLRWGIWEGLQACVSMCVNISRFGIVAWGEEWRGREVRETRWMRKGASATKSQSKVKLQHPQKQQKQTLRADVESETQHFVYGVCTCVRERKSERERARALTLTSS